MDPFTSDWTTAESKAFKEALAEVDLDSSNWFEHLTIRFPNKTPEQLRDHYMDLLVAVESIESGQVLNPIYSNPRAVKMTTGMEDLLMIDLPYSPEFSGTGSMCSRIGSMSGPENKVEVEDLLPVDKGENEAKLSRESMKEGFFLPTDKGLMDESSHELVMEQDMLTPEIEEVLKLLSPEITEGDNEVLLRETKGTTMVLPETVTELQCGGKILREVTGAAVGKRLVEELETSTSKKGEIWSEEEHRFDE